MRQKTKNHQNQGSIDKKFDFFPQSLGHIPRWVHLVQKTRAKNSHAWAPLRKFRVEQLQSHIWGRVSQYMRKWGNIFSYIRRPLVILYSIWLCNCSILNFLIYGEILIFFSSVYGAKGVELQFFLYSQKKRSFSAALDQSEHLLLTGNFKSLIF
jgi:hypothetical protein